MKLGGGKYFCTFLVILLVFLVIILGNAFFSYSEYKSGYMIGYKDGVEIFNSKIIEYSSLELSDPSDIQNHEEVVNILFKTIAECQNEPKEIDIIWAFIFKRNINSYESGRSNANERLNRTLIDKFSKYRRDFVDGIGIKKYELFVDSIQNEKNSTKKCELIAEWITGNFSSIYLSQDKESLFYKDLYLRQQSAPNFTHNYFCGDYPDRHFGFDKNGRIRANSIHEFSSDPYWFIFMNTGACGEMAYMFNETVNRAGIITRIVISDNPDHVWNEIFIDNEWLYADTTLYILENRSWIGNPYGYNSNSNSGKMIEVYVMGKEIDRSLVYA